jgi:hypothetical protein
VAAGGSLVAWKTGTAAGHTAGELEAAARALKLKELLGLCVLSIALGFCVEARPAIYQPCAAVRILTWVLEKSSVGTAVLRPALTPRAGRAVATDWTNPGLERSNPNPAASFWYCAATVCLRVEFLGSSVERKSRGELAGGTVRERP